MNCFAILAIAIPCLCKLFNSTEQSKAGELNPNTVSVVFYHPETHKIQENYGIAGATQQGAYKFLLMGDAKNIRLEETVWY